MEIAVSSQPAAPWRGAGFLFIALAGMLAWLVLSLAFYGTADVSQLRAADAIWCWVVLAVAQLSVTRADDSPLYRWLATPLLAAGLAFCVVRQLSQPLVFRGHNLSAYIEAALVLLAAARVVWQALQCLAGREVHVADLCLFIMIQWALFWTAATAVLSWRTAGNIELASRQMLLESSLLGIGFHAAVLLALRHLPKKLGGNIRLRAILLMLPLYNVGLIGLIMHWPWIGCTLMFLGVMVTLVALSGLFAGSRGGLALLTIFACVFLAAACGMRPFDNTLYAGWRHAGAAGMVGLTVVITLAVSASASVPAFGASRVLVGVGSACYIIGVVARIGVEIAETSDFSRHSAATLGSVLEILGLILVALAAARSHMVRHSLASEPAGVSR